MLLQVMQSSHESPFGGGRAGARAMTALTLLGGGRAGERRRYHDQVVLGASQRGRARCTIRYSPESQNGGSSNGRGDGTPVRLIAVGEWWEVPYFEQLRSHSRGGVCRGKRGPDRQGGAACLRPPTTALDG